MSELLKTRMEIASKRTRAYQREQAQIESFKKYIDNWRKNHVK